MNTLLLLIALVPGEDLPPTPRPMPPTPRPAERVYDDYDKAYNEAVRTGRPLLVWVGQRPHVLAGCVSVYQPTFPDSAPPCVVVSVPRDGTLLRIADMPGTTTDAEIQEVLNAWKQPDPKQAGSLPVPISSPDVPLAAPVRFVNSKQAKVPPLGPAAPILVRSARLSASC